VTANPSWEMQLPIMVGSQVSEITITYRGFDHRNDCHWYMYVVELPGKERFRGFAGISEEAGVPFHENPAHAPPHTWIYEQTKWSVLTFAIRKSLRTMVQYPDQWKKWSGLRAV